MVSDALYEEFIPEFIVPPGETLLETIEDLGISQTELAKRTGRPLKTINEIIKGKTRITEETSLQLEKVLGIPSSFWNTLEKNYREAIAREVEKVNLSKSVEWLDEFPIAEMIKNKWIKKKEDKIEQLKELFSFFGVVSIDSWETLWDSQVSFRQSQAFKSNEYSIITYLRKAELDSRKVICEPYNEPDFKKFICESRKLTLIDSPDEFVPKLINGAAKCGVSIVFLPEINGTRLSGATKWIASDKAMIVLSLRHKTNDHLWFTFFHEAAHIILHSKKDTFIDESAGGEVLDNKEQEANEFSANHMIPPKDYNDFTTNNKRPSKNAIKNFAANINIHPGIVVGRLQRDGVIKYSYFNDLKVRYTWKK